MNVRRYDCAIYLHESKSLILIQISIKKTMKQLEKYNEENYEKDIHDMQKFLRINNLEVEEYYLFFILDMENYRDESNRKLFKNFNLDYCLFDYNDTIIF